MRCKHCDYTCKTLAELSHHTKEKHPELSGYRGTKKGQQAKALSATGSPTPPADTDGRQPLPHNPEGALTAEDTAKSTSMAPLDAQGQFQALLNRWEIKHGDAIADFMAAHDAFEDPNKMARVLVAANVLAPQRRQIMEHWFATKAMAIPPEILSRVSLTEEEAKEKDKEKEEAKAKWGVDQNTGGLRQALEGEKGLTKAEAEWLSGQIKREKGITGGEPQPQEPRFIPDPADPEGWTVNPNAKNIGGVDILTAQALKSARQRGESVDPQEMFIRMGESLKVLKDVVGGGQQPQQGTSTTELINLITTVVGLTQPGKGLDDLKDELRRIRETPQGPTAADQQITALSKSLDEMKAEIAKQREEALQSQLGAVRTELQNLRGQLTQAQESGQQKNEYTIMEKGLSTIDSRMAGLEGIIRTVIGKPPAPMPSAERQALAEGLAKEAQASTELDALGKALFFKGK